MFENHSYALSLFVKIYYSQQNLRVYKDPLLSRLQMGKMSYSCLLFQFSMAAVDIGGPKVWDNEVQKISGLKGKNIADLSSYNTYKPVWSHITVIVNLHFATKLKEKTEDGFNSSVAVHTHFGLKIFLTITLITIRLEQAFHVLICYGLFDNESWRGKQCRNNLTLKLCQHPERDGNHAHRNVQL